MHTLQHLSMPTDSSHQHHGPMSLQTSLLPGYNLRQRPLAVPGVSTHSIFLFAPCAPVGLWLCSVLILTQTSSASSADGGRMKCFDNMAPMPLFLITVYLPIHNASGAQHPPMPLWSPSTIQGKRGPVAKLSQLYRIVKLLGHRGQELNLSNPAH
jgi:hypothetical protein